MADNFNRSVADWNDGGKSGRRSIYSGSNGVRFLPKMIQPTEQFIDAVSLLRDVLEDPSIKEIH
ncbi:hypothetical protein [Risungbinella massiliensis]|uniref:hypothetical protein n=1 Tax=Risungbinella massiliensis TaxID=1329796 RepID=UPI00069A9560|nr:hypothetical protein [Risungbinella massiliensis]